VSAPPAILAGVAAYYSAKVSAHGPTARGADWNSPESQELRFEHLLRLCDQPGPFSVNDYGCGYGALAAFLGRRGLDVRYCGFDVAPAMLDEARRFVADLGDCTFVDDPARLAPADYTLASGIFNVRLDTPIDTWEGHVEATLAHMASVSRRGFAFNMLTAYADPERMRPDLYYADPLATFARCRSYSRRVALLHDYPLWEFTVLVRLP
jgi:SAM-dependent methyltransferase